MKIDEELNPPVARLGQVDRRDRAGSRSARPSSSSCASASGTAAPGQRVLTTGQRRAALDGRQRCRRPDNGRPVPQLQLPGRARRDRPGQLHRVQRARLDHRGHRDARGRRQHHRPQAARQDHLRQHHAEVGADRRPPSCGTGASRSSTAPSCARTARSWCSTWPTSTEVARWNFVRAWPTQVGRPGVQRQGQRHRRSRRWCSRTRVSSGPDGSLVTEYDFELPKGYVDADGTLHRDGTMRLATAADEIHPLQGSAGAGLARLPHHHPAVAGGDELGSADRRSTRA